MAGMTRRERLTAIFEGRTPDRPAVKLWRADPRKGSRFPVYQPILDLAGERCDLMVDSGSPFEILWGREHERHIHRIERPTDSPKLVEVVTTVETPAGPLRSVFTRSTVGEPGYETEYLLKDPSDLDKLLAIPYEPIPLEPERWTRDDREVGDAGIALFNLDHAMYALQRLIGSENFALWSFEAEEKMLELMTVFADRIRGHAEAAIEAGVGFAFAWVGPELCIPPLMSLDHFDRYVGALDRPLIERLHEADRRVWVHCHGRMSPVIDRFAAMGADVLNPVEPPPMGDLTLEQAFERVGDRMALEGNLETHDLMTAEDATVRAKIDQLLAIGSRPGRRFILCPSSGYDEVPEPSEQHLQNLRTYIEFGVEQATATMDS